MDSDTNRQLAKPLMGSGAEAARRVFPPGSAAGLALGPAAGFREPRTEARTEGYAPLPQGNDRPPVPKVTALGVVEVCAWPPTSAPADAATLTNPDTCRSVPVLLGLKRCAHRQLATTSHSPLRAAVAH
jgi:hypothetical protein